MKNEKVAKGRIIGLAGPCYKGLRIGDLRLHAALTWRDFRFIVIRAFYPFLASFVNQRTLFVFPNN